MINWIKKKIDNDTLFYYALLATNLVSIAAILFNYFVNSESIEWVYFVMSGLISMLSFELILEKEK